MILWIVERLWRIKCWFGYHYFWDPKEVNCLISYMQTLNKLNLTGHVDSFSVYWMYWMLLSCRKCGKMPYE